MKLVSYLKRRIQFIREQLPKAKEQNEVLLRNGVIPENLKDELKELENTAEDSNEPLTFLEYTSYNTYFEIYPEKVLGKEVITTSREFPITIKGDAEIIEKKLYKQFLMGIIIIPLPIGWRVYSVNPSPLRIEYASTQNDLLRIDDFEDKTFALFHFKDGVLKASHRYDSLQLVNYHIITDHFRIQIKPQPRISDLELIELEAIALEIELQLLTL